MSFNPHQLDNDLPALPPPTGSHPSVRRKLWRNADRSSTKHSSTCPNTGAFGPCLLNMSIAWRYPAPSVHFLEEFVHVRRPRHRYGLRSLGISSRVLKLIALCLRIGKDILTCQAEKDWGAKVIEHLSLAKRTSFSQIKGFTVANVHYIHAFAEAWSDPAIVQQAVGQLPWDDNILHLTHPQALECPCASDRQTIELKNSTFKPEQRHMNIPSIETIEAELATKILPYEINDGGAS